MDYDKRLETEFKDLEISLVKHDTSATGYPLYVEVKLGKAPKDKGATAMDLGNYLYRRFGVNYEPVPEYLGRGKNTTLRFFVSWEKGKATIDQINTFYAKRVIKADHFLAFEFNRTLLQVGAR
jgi:hypothetical protein